MECHYFLPILGYTPQEKMIKEPIIAAAQLGVPSPCIVGLYIVSTNE